VYPYRLITSYILLCRGSLSLGGSGRGRGSGVGRGASGVDVAADQSLAEDGQEAALGLLALSGAGGDELVGGRGGNGG
jgi:hypothetical protein